MESGKLSMTTGLTIPEAKALRALAQSIKAETPWVADVGSWKGFSCTILAQGIKPHGGRIIAVDHWKGNPGTLIGEIARKEDICGIFNHNMEVLGLTDMVHVFSMTSSQALGIIQDNVLALVFLDADHRYTPVRADIEGWWKKLRTGGILCGHDCEMHYLGYPKEIRKFIDEHLEEDYLVEIGCHPGVTRALYDCFQSDYNLVPETRIWFRRKVDGEGFIRRD